MAVLHFSPLLAKKISQEELRCPSKTAVSVVVVVVVLMTMLIMNNDP
jgi:hypothetical protein